MKTNTVVGIAMILAVFWHHAYLARVESEQPLDDLRRHVVELQVQTQELEHQAAINSNPDLSFYEELIRQQEFEAQKKPGIATAYSCGGITSEAERLMNCPNGVTASGTVPRIRTTLACDKSLLGKTVEMTFKSGKTIVGDCEDTGGAITEHRFDIYLSDVHEARQFGRQELIYLVK